MTSKGRKATPKSQNVTEKNITKPTFNQPSPTGNDNHVKRSVIIGDSLVSKLDGWRMSNKLSRVSVKAFPGSTTKDMTDYIKPSIKHHPNHLILHVGTNDLKKDEPQEIAENIVKICELVERESPNTDIAVSELILREDSKALNDKRLSVNKILHSFAKTRDWKIISHHQIDTTSLNGRGLHLNRRGTALLAKDFSQHLTNQN